VKVIEDNEAHIRPMETRQKTIGEADNERHRDIAQRVISFAESGAFPVEETKFNKYEQPL
jgi:hypothetical protein